MMQATLLNWVFIENPICLRASILDIDGGNRTADVGTRDVPGECTLGPPGWK